jgi:hypothetical protein
MPRARHDAVLAMLRDFVTANEDPRVSPNYKDDVHPQPLNPKP